MSQSVIQDYWQPIVQSYCAGNSALPLNLGLSEEAFTSILKAVDLELPILKPEVAANAQLRFELLNMRVSELEELESLLKKSLNTDLLYGEEMVRVLASACLGSQHLWHDLGMPERPRLTSLFGDYFPKLRAKNVHNMRWKRFLYRQLCENGGDYICRSPSCEQCSSYAECFNLEEH